jgi:YXWGXW repeat-containing protein
MRALITALVVAGTLLTSACVGASGRVYIRSGPPPVRAEVVARSPGPGYVWVPGYYAYERGGYAWVPGRYERPPRGRARWVPSHWERDRRGWYFVEGRWR